MTRRLPTPETKPTGRDRGAVSKPPAREPDEKMVDEALDETFPASDPPSFGGATGTGAPDDARPGKPKQ